MREIKFRAWDKKFKVMIPSVVAYDNDNVIVVDTIINQTYNDDDLDERLNDVEGAGPEHYCITGDIEVMQFTGLLDTNGKEIYEGDIVKHFGDNDFVHEIKFKHGAFGYDSLVAPEKFVTYSETRIHEIETVEIIGNTYENPELIIK